MTCKTIPFDNTMTTEHTCTDPHVWQAYIEIDYYGETKQFRGISDTRAGAIADAVAEVQCSLGY